MATTPPPKPLEDIPEFAEGAENKGTSTPPPPPQEQK